jgi:GntR family transcriptional regulator
VSVPEPVEERLPKAFRLKEQLLEHLRRLEPGSPIDSERVLADRYGVARATVRQALQELIFEGRLYRFQGKGTFVARPKLTQTLHLTSHTHDMAYSGLVPSSQLLAAEIVEAAGEVGEALGLPPDTPVHKIKRLRLANGEPMAIESLFVEQERFADLATRIGAGASFYALLGEVYAVALSGGEETIECILASPSAARLLATEPRSPMLRLTRRSWDSDRRPVEYVESIYRGDRYRFMAPLQLPATQENPA